VYLAFLEPGKDRKLQAAVKANRVMTVMQAHEGTHTDHGIVGFESGRNRQFLIFPKSLRTFAGRTVVGIKYDLLDSHEIPKKDRAPRPRPPLPKQTAPQTKAPRKALNPPKRTAPAPHVSEKLVPFKVHPEESDSEEVSALKKDIRRAMALLEEGKAVAAFNLLKRAVGG